MKKARISKKQIAMVLVTALAIIIFLFIQINSSKHVIPGEMVPLGKIMIPMNSIQGLLQNIILMSSICLACLDCNKGFAIGVTITGASMLSTIIQVVVGKNHHVLPGFAMCILTIAVMCVISYLLRIAQRNSVTDIMTGLKNQRGFLYTLEPMIGKKKNAIAYYLLNNYRAINDEYGHEAGDRILKVVGKKMQSVIGKDGEVFRIGGAVFSIIYKEGVDAEAKTKEIVDVLSEKTVVAVEGVEKPVEYFAESNAGVVYLNDRITSKDQAVKCADVAVMNATQRGMNIVALYDETMSLEEIEIKKTEQLINKGLKEEKFFFVYQPQYFVKDKKIRGFEALIRLEGDDGETVSPAKFIPVAERSTLVNDIDKYVLRYVAREFADIVKEYSDIRVSVNISANGFGSEGFVDTVKSIMEECKFPYENLEIEITEYSMSKNQEVTKRNIEELHKLGVYIALDDFGTGYTTLAKLLELKANVLKIDKSIVDTIENTDVNRKFVNTIGDMGHLLNCEVLLEGVETDSQLEYIKGMACDCVQGFVWGRPISFEEAIAKLHC